MSDLWLPQSDCDPNCLPRPGETPTVNLAIRVARVAGAAGVLAVAIVLTPVLPLLPQQRRSAFARVCARLLLRALGVRLVTRGVFPRRQALLAANHVSWLDILVVMAQSPVRLVAKLEVKGWPVIGTLSASARAIFIDRARPRSLPDTVATIADALRSGDVVAAFPEGTTWCGRTSGRFRPALFQAALDANATVVPMTLRFEYADGTDTTVAAFIGDESLLVSLRRVVAARGLTVVAVVSAALHPAPAATRAGLARLAESAVAVRSVTPRRPPVERPRDMRLAA